MENFNTHLYVGFSHNEIKSHVSHICSNNNHLHIYLNIPHIHAAYIYISHNYMVQLRCNFTLAREQYTRTLK